MPFLKEFIIKEKTKVRLWKVMTGELNTKELNSDEKNYIHCAGGYRSVIACSILKRNGYESVVDVAGGFSSIRKSNFDILVNE